MLAMATRLATFHHIKLSRISWTENCGPKGDGGLGTKERGFWDAAITVLQSVPVLDALRTAKFNGATAEMLPHIGRIAPPTTHQGGPNPRAKASGVRAGVGLGHSGVCGIRHRIGSKPAFCCRPVSRSRWSPLRLSGSLLAPVAATLSWPTSSARRDVLVLVVLLLAKSPLPWARLERRAFNALPAVDKNARERVKSSGRQRPAMERKT
ncbi:GD16428 [Drosophila simulans]|uniref:GD16428 n=1 Tax=Drosophila simulans TaxID=7240 RepID=B4R2N3_DROSI|nr:GD16428 [Drosophila simulans]